MSIYRDSFLCENEVCLLIREVGNNRSSVCKITHHAESTERKVLRPRGHDCARAGSARRTELQQKCTPAEIKWVTKVLAQLGHPSSTAVAAALQEMHSDERLVSCARMYVCEPCMRLCYSCACGVCMFRFVVYVGS